MGCRYALARTIIAATLLAGAPSAAPAQCRLCSTPTTERPKGDLGSEIRLDVETTLDFDRLVLVGGGEGSATLLPSGERSASGSIATVGAGAMVGSVTVRGEPGRMLLVDLPPRIELYSLGGSRITIERVESDLPSLPKLDSSGTLTFRFGGQLTVSGDSEGEYRGDVPISVDYL